MEGGAQPRRVASVAVGKRPQKNSSDFVYAILQVQSSFEASQGPGDSKSGVPAARTAEAAGSLRRNAFARSAKSSRGFWTHVLSVMHTVSNDPARRAGRRSSISTKQTAKKPSHERSKKRSHTCWSASNGMEYAKSVEIHWNAKKYSSKPSASRCAASSGSWCSTTTLSAPASLRSVGRPSSYTPRRLYFGLVSSSIVRRCASASVLQWSSIYATQKFIP
mmetsp:Transcript_12623/g.35631  ORF Transcript_12623/g.35631 Transcript_12623/m.35631 type:complete len:220 (+) Transcript_12623:97-756(+)